MRQMKTNMNKIRIFDNIHNFKNKKTRTCMVDSIVHLGKSQVSKCGTKDMGSVLLVSEFRNHIPRVQRIPKLWT